MEDANKLCIVSAGNSEIKDNYIIGSSHNAVRVWNLNTEEYSEHIAERNVNAKIVAMCAHTNLSSTKIAPDDIYIAYAGDIQSDGKARNNTKVDVADIRKTHSKGRTRRRSSVSSTRKLINGSKYLITIWKWNCTSRKRYVHASLDCNTFGAHSGTIGSLVIIDGESTHNRHDIIQENPLLVSGSEDKTVKIWNLYTREPIYFVSVAGGHFGDMSHVSNVLNVSSNVPALHAYYPDKSSIEIQSTRTTSASNTEMMDVPHLFIGTEDGSILCYNFFIAEHMSEYPDNPFENEDSHVCRDSLMDTGIDAGASGNNANNTNNTNNANNLENSCSYRDTDRDPDTVLHVDRLQFSLSLGRRFRLKGHTDGVNDFALLKQKNHNLESMKEVCICVICTCALFIYMYL